MSAARVTHSPLHALMALALAMENEAAQRYGELADTMEAHNNLEVAALFRKMAAIEAGHAGEIQRRMGWTAPPAPMPDAPGWPGLDAPETVPGDDLHYLMRPWHALQLALAAERRAHDFFERLVRVADDDGVRDAALQMQHEEAEHIALMLSWIERFPPPEADWALDPDPPRYND